MMQTRFQRTLLVIFPIVLAVSFMTGCSSNRYKITDDVAPNNAPDVSQVENAYPRFEPFSKGGNKPYTVRGKHYTVLATNKDYKAKGMASWYGTKFHGHLTSNGETYDMYSMSAAHKTLPLPSYVKVTNLNNNKHVIVRVNDRGPFHDNRIIDLSYAAAFQLDMLKTGTTPVKVESIYVPNPKLIRAKKTEIQPQQYIQIVALKNQSNIIEIASIMADKYKLKYRLQEKGGVYRLQLGPLKQKNLTTKLLEKIKQNDYPHSFIVSD